MHLRIITFGVLPAKGVVLMSVSNMQKKIQEKTLSLHGTEGRVTASERNDL